MVLSFVIIFADKKKTLATLIVAKKKKGWAMVKGHRNLEMSELE